MPKGKRKVQKDVKGAVQIEKRGRPKGSLNKPKVIHKYQCGLCRDSFKTMPEKRVHNRDYHDIDQKVKMLSILCADGRTVSFELQINEEGSLICPQCEFTYATSGGLSWHIKKHMELLGAEQMKGLTTILDNHYNIVPITPNQDDKIDEDEEGLDGPIGVQETRVQTLPPKFPCAKCSIPFDDSEQLKVHNYTYHKYKYFLVAESHLEEVFHFIIMRNHGLVKCPLCSSKYRSISILDEHMQTRHAVATWITQEKLKDQASVVSNEEQEHYEDLSYLYQPALTFHPQKQESSLWKTIKSLLWS